MIFCLGFQGSRLRGAMRFAYLAWKFHKSAQGSRGIRKYPKKSRINDSERLRNYFLWNQ